MSAGLGEFLRFRTLNRKLVCLATLLVALPLPLALAAEVPSDIVHLNAPIALEQLLPCAPRDPLKYFTLSAPDGQRVEAVILCRDGALQLYLPLAAQNPSPPPPLPPQEER